MDTELLLTFLTVAEAGGISAAGRVLYRSQPAITERLQKLTKLVGEPLYIHTGRGIHLTPAGEALLPAARRLRNVAKEIHGTIIRRQQLREGILRIAATNTVASYFLPQYLVAFRGRYPDVDIHLRGGVINWSDISIPDWDLFFLEGGFDLDGLPPYYSVSPWLQDEIVAILPIGHPLLAKEKIEWEHLLQYPLIWRERTSGIRRTIEQEFKKQQLTPRQSIEVTGVDAVGAAVDAGLGIGFVTAAALEYRKDWRVVARRIPYPQGIRWTLYTAIPQPIYQSQTIHEFFDFLHNYKK